VSWRPAGAIFLLDAPFGRVFFSFSSFSPLFLLFFSSFLFFFSPFWWLSPHRKKALFLKARARQG